MNSQSSYLRTPLTTKNGGMEFIASNQTECNPETNKKVLIPMPNFSTPVSNLPQSSTQDFNLNQILGFASDQWKVNNIGYPVEPFTNKNFRGVNSDLVLDSTHLLLDIDLDDSRINNSLIYMPVGPLSPLDDRFSLITQFCVNYPNNNTNGGIPPNNPLDGLLLACKQRHIIPLELVFKHLTNITKVSAGAFGEVFTGTFTEEDIISIYKVVPVDSYENRPKAYSLLHYEIVISKLLNKLRDPIGENYTTGFVKFYRARVLEGKYPQSLLDARSEYKKNSTYPENTDPIFKNSLQFVIFEFEPVGITALNYKFKNAEQMLHVLIQVTFAMAAAEAELKFKHNDLHLGNVLVLETAKDSRSYKIDGKSYQIPTHGVRATIIDFSLAKCLEATALVPSAHDHVFSGQPNMGVSTFAAYLYRRALMILPTNCNPYLEELRKFQGTILQFTTLVGYVNSDECVKYLA